MVHILETVAAFWQRKRDAVCDELTRAGVPSDAAQAAVADADQLLVIQGRHATPDAIVNCLFGNLSTALARCSNIANLRPSIESMLGVRAPDVAGNL
jgi:hypothetical protein